LQSLELSVTEGYNWYSGSTLSMQQWAINNGANVTSSGRVASSEFIKNFELWFKRQVRFA